MGIGLRTNTYIAFCAGIALPVMWTLLSQSVLSSFQNTVSEITRSAMWYDFFSLYYDRALEKRYRNARAQTVAALGVTPGSLVLDVACGTGQNFPLLQHYIGDGEIVGVDASRGMLARARQRVETLGWGNVHLIQSDIHTFGPDQLDEHGGRAAADFVLCTLGLTVIPDWEAAFRRGYDLLRRGGRIVLMDAYAEEWVLQTWLSQVAARADLSRRFWEPLEVVAEDFDLVTLPGSPHEFGGRLYLASGTKC